MEAHATYRVVEAQLCSALPAAEPSSSGGEEESTLSLLDKGRALLTAFQPAYWQALVVVGILYMARYDMSFGTLRAKTVRRGGWEEAFGRGRLS